VTSSAHIGAFGCFGLGPEAFHIVQVRFHGGRAAFRKHRFDSPKTALEFVVGLA